MTTNTVLDLRDLRFLEVACPNCNQGITFDLERAAQLPEVCAGCERKYDSEAGEAVALLGRAYQTRHQTASVRFPRVGVGGSSQAA